MRKTTNGNQLPIDRPDEESRDLRQYVEILRKHIWVICAVAALGVTAVVLFTMRQPKVYQATASVIIDPQPPQVFGAQVQEVIQLGAGTYWSNQQYYNTQVDILRNYDLVRLTVVQHSLWEDPRLISPQGEARTRDELIAEATRLIAKALTAKQNAESRVVTVLVDHTNEDLAIDVANKHVATFIDFTRGLRTDGSGEISKFLANELDAAQARLRDSEERLYKFKEKIGILSISLEDKQNILAQDIAKYTAALSDARIKRIELAAIRERVEKIDGEDALESPIFGLTSNKIAIDDLQENYTAAKHRLAELSAEFGPLHPAYKSQRSKVDELYGLIQMEAKRAKRDLDERFAAAVAAERQFQSEVERLKAVAFELGPKVIEYNRLQREHSSDEENYNLVLNRLRTSELSGRNEAVNIRRHKIARDAKLVAPRMKMNIALGFALSFMVGIGLAFLLDYVDRTIKSAEDVERLIGAPLLGIIPVVEEVTQGQMADVLRDRDLFVFQNPTSQAAECCRSIRTNILFSSADRPMKTMTISSPRPREGKTTATIYLGTTMAQSGQRVLLLDTDLRRPRLHKSVGVSRNVGITNLILGDAVLEDVIKTTEIPNLFVIPCGPTPPNPAELLLTQRFKEVITEIEARFDRVLLDSPPLLAVTDAVVLARLSDGVVMVAQAGKTAGDDVRQSARMLRDVDASILGVVLNDLDLSDRRYGYYYYAYGYGYTEKQEKLEQPT